MPDNDPPDACGKAAYDAYCEFRNWESFRGDALPFWDQVKPDIREGWKVAGAAAAKREHERIGKRVAEWSAMADQCDERVTKAQTPGSGLIMSELEMAKNEQAARTYRTCATSLTESPLAAHIEVPADLADKLQEAASAEGMLMGDFIRKKLADFAG